MLIQLNHQIEYQLIEINNEVGYFDYGGCLFPQGEMKSNFYFNDEDIKEVNF